MHSTGHSHWASITRKYRKAGFARRSAEGCTEATRKPSRTRSSSWFVDLVTNPVRSYWLTTNTLNGEAARQSTQVVGLDAQARARVLPGVPQPYSRRLTSLRTQRVSPTTGTNVVWPPFSRLRRPAVSLSCWPTPEKGRRHRRRRYRYEIAAVCFPFLLLSFELYASREPSCVSCVSGSDASIPSMGYRRPRIA